MNSRPAIFASMAFVLGLPQICIWARLGTMNLPDAVLISTTMAVVSVMAYSLGRRSKTDSTSGHNLPADPETNQVDQHHASENKLLELVFDQLPVGLMITDAEGRVIRRNARHFALLGVAGDSTSVHQAASGFEGNSKLCSAQVAFQSSDTNAAGADSEHCRMRSGVACRGELGEKTFSLKNEHGKSPGFVRMLCDNCEHTMNSGLLRASEKRMRFALESLRTLAWDWDLRTGELDTSEPIGVWLGHRDTDIVRRIDDLLALMHPDDVPEFRRRIDDVQACQCEFRLQSGDGRYLGFLLRGSRHTDEAGVPIDRFTGVMTDITDLRRDQERLRLLESAVVHARDAVVVLESEPHQGPGRSVLYANDAFCRMTGYTTDEILGRSLHFLRGPDSDPRTLEQLRTALSQGLAFTGELLNYRKDGTPYWVELSVVPVPDPLGSPAHWVMIQRDVSDRKQTEEEVRRTGRLLRAIIDLFPGHIDVTDRNGRYLLMNQALASDLGTLPEDTIGRNLQEFLPADLAAECAERDECVLAGNSLQFEVTSLNSDGTRRHWLATKVPLPDAPGSDGRNSVAGVVSVFVNVTELKSVQETLRKSEAMLADAQRIAHIGSWEYDPHAGTLVWSAEKYRIHGISPESLPPTFDQYLRMIHPQDTLAFRQAADEAVRTACPGSVDYRVVRPNGEVRDVHDEYHPMTDPDGKVVLYRGVTQDITERRQAEQQFFHAQKMEVVGQMAGGIAHDFNNLLTAIIGNLTLVPLPHGSSEKKHVQTALRAAHRAAELTRKLLGFARKNQLSVAPFSVHDLISDTYEFISRTFDPRVDIVTEVATAAFVSVDLTLMSQVLLNLCMNARDAMPNGGRLVIRGETVRTHDPQQPDSRVAEYVRISVEDNGVGMTPEVKSHIFEPFFTTKPVGKGTGLGLPMVHGTMVQHHGWVVCESELGCGTRFELYLPKLAGEGPARKSGMVSWASADRSRPLTATPPPKIDRPACILLVDDEEMIRTIGRVMLESGGMRVIEAVDGADALELYRQHRAEIDLIILDLTMPRMSGHDTCRAIRQLDSSARILFSSGYSSEDVTPSEGAIGLLPKPYRPQELLEAVHRGLATELPGNSCSPCSEPDNAITSATVSFL